MNKITLSIVLILVLSISCKKAPTPLATKSDILFENLDTTVAPGEDFFNYANGGWIKKNPIPGEQSSWGIGNLVIEENLKRLSEIAIKAAASNAPKGSIDQKIGDFWAEAMDTIKIESSGLGPLQAYLDQINETKDIPALINLVAELKKIGSSTFFAEFVGQDDKNSEATIFQFYQGGIGLPEREYYIKKDSATVHIRNKYVEYISRILVFGGADSVYAKKSAENILQAETKMAIASRKIEDLRDPYANYNKMAVKDLTKLGKIIPWNDFIKNIGIEKIDSVIVGQPEFFTSLNKIISTVPLSVWKDYVRFNLISDFSNSLPDKIGKEAFEFSRLFSGAKERRPRWKRSMSSMENVLGEALGQLYVKEFFNETAKKRYDVATEAIRDALKSRIENLTWMSDSTKAQAYKKLSTVNKKVGYPEKWKDFSTLELGRESYTKNLMQANRWWHDFELNKLGKPVDRDEWHMYPQTYNAGYNPSNNDITLPAGIFTVPGFRDEELDDALIYGYAGASTIGHEITHGFDDQGREYDEKGNLAKWWTETDEKEFTKRADVMIKQFNEFEPLPGYPINGEATLGENIADLGGILLGIEAFKKTNQYKEGKSINGLNPMQRYFLGYALGWLGHEREESLRNQLLTDVHSPAKYRVNGPFADVDEFYTTFNIKPGDKMYREDSLRVKIW